jgi:hypothetical protein
MNNLVS